MSEQHPTDEQAPSSGDADSGPALARDEAVLEASEPATETSGEREPAGRGPGASLTGLFALALALLATMVAGFLWWQYREFYVALAAADEDTALALERVRADLRAAADRLSDLDEALDRQQRASERIDDRVDALPPRFAELERRLDVQQGSSFDARAEWLRAEAEYYLTLANTELELAGHWENATKALELADRRLAELANPALGRVRELIADELIALRGVRLPDIAGLTFSLGRLADRSAELPLRAELPATFGDRGATAEQVEPGLARLWATLKEAVLGVVRVERRSAPVAQVLSAEERSLARRQLVLELQVARVAVLRAEPQAFEAGLRSAIELLRRDFDASAAEVEGAIGLLTGMLELDVAPERPDISASLNLLRTLPAGAD